MLFARVVTLDCRRRCQLFAVQIAVAAGVTLRAGNKHRDGVAQEEMHRITLADLRVMGGQLINDQAVALLLLTRAGLQNNNADQLLLAWGKRRHCRAADDLICLRQNIFTVGLRPVIDADLRVDGGIATVSEIERRGPLIALQIQSDGGNLQRSPQGIAREQQQGQQPKKGKKIRPTHD